MSIEAAALGLKQATTQQTIAYSMIKSNAKADQAVANMVEKGSLNAASSARGQIVDITA